MKYQAKQIFYIYTAFLGILSLSIFLMPFGFKIADKTKILTYISGVVFWIGLVGTISAAVYITHLRKRSKEFPEAYTNYRQLGLIHFFQNVPAIICDALMIASLIGFVITRILLGKTVFPFIFLSLLIFFFGMHCMLNGSNYIYIKYKARRRTEL